jgi:hypothetical protein
VDLGKQGVKPVFRRQFDKAGNMAMMGGMSTDFNFAPQTRDGHRPAL